MVGTVGFNPVPVAVAHDPLGRAMTEEQKSRLREQPLPPIEEALAKERIVDRRQETAPRKQTLPAPHADDDQDDDGPGHFIDSYV